MKFKTILHTQRWKNYTSYYLMESTGKGMVRITKYDDEDFFEISDLFVDPLVRKMGLGTFLIEQVKKLVFKRDTKTTLQLHFSKDISEPFIEEWYKRLGFIFDHTECVIEDDEELGEWYNVYKLII